MPSQYGVEISGHRRLDIDKVVGVFNEGGLFSDALPGYEHRPPQMDMVRKICLAFNENKYALVEAGTGTGKSLAYLVPAVIWAIESDSKVVISTNTINLQEQLVNKDIPFLERYLGVYFKAVLVKGRGNYLCRRKLDAWSRTVEGTGTQSEKAAVEQYRGWADRSADGSKASISPDIPLEYWNHLASQGDTCLRNKCPWYSKCFFAQARKEAEDADILVVNHHLLFADIAVKRDMEGEEQDGGVLPAYKHLIFDEAHNIEAVATEYLGYQVDTQELTYLLGSIYRRRSDKDFTGIVAAIKKGLSFIGLEENAIEAGKIRMSLDESIMPKLEAVHALIDRLFKTLWTFCRTSGAADGTMGRLRLRPALIASQEWRSQVQIPWGQLFLALEDLSKCLWILLNDIKEFKEQWGVIDDSVIIELSAIQNKIKGVAKSVEFIGRAEDDGFVYWVEVSGDDAAPGGSLRAAPLDVAPYIKEELLDRLETGVFTSATLSINGNFRFLKHTLGFNGISADRVIEGCIQSPFDYQRQALICMPNDIPYPDSPDYVESIAKAIMAVVSASSGRALVLFTSYSMLIQVYRLVAEPLKSEGLMVLRQGEMPRSVLLDRLRSDGCILLATDSFWEGVDIPGSALSVVILVKLPFRVPTDPIQEARYESLERAGKNPFLWYSLPQAVIRFKQGFGRLIRTKSDRGTVVIYDRRVMDRQYGQVFLKSLPECRQVAGATETICREVYSWLAPK